MAYFSRLTASSGYSPLSRSSVAHRPTALIGSIRSPAVLPPPRTFVRVAPRAGEDGRGGDFDLVPAGRAANRYRYRHATSSRRSSLVVAARPGEETPALRSR